MINRSASSFSIIRSSPTEKMIPVPPWPDTLSRQLGAGVRCNLQVGWVASEEPEAEEVPVDGSNGGEACKQTGQLRSNMTCLPALSVLYIEFVGSE
jgi:hypothetical protein